MSQMHENSAAQADTGPVIAKGIDDEPLAGNQRSFGSWTGWGIAVLCVLYTAFHIVILNFYPLETWTYRMIHVTGGLFLGFLIYSAKSLSAEADEAVGRNPLEWIMMAVAGAGIGYGAALIAYAWAGWWLAGTAVPAPFLFGTYGIPLLVGTVAAIAAAWFFSGTRPERVYWADALLGVAAIAVLGYILFNVGALRLRAGTGMAQSGDFYAALVGVLLILEVTRRVAVRQRWRSSPLA